MSSVAGAKQKHLRGFLAILVARPTQG